MLVGLSRTMVSLFSETFDHNILRADPTNIMEAVVTGISFLGAGTIIRHHSEKGIEGLTTAASILIAASIGIGVALSQFALASGVTIIVLVTLRGISYVERWLEKHNLQDNNDDH
jgi:putative Mg2+ transporter-C (MgtC) family protein